MFKRLLRGARRLGTVEYCEACGSVCDAACRSRRIREANRDRMLATVVVR